MEIPKKRLILGGIAACFISAAGLIAITQQHKSLKKTLQATQVQPTPIKVIFFDIHGVLLNNSHLAIMQEIGFIPILIYSILEQKNPLKLRHKIMEIISHVACQEGRTRKTGIYTTYENTVIPLCMEQWQMGTVSSEKIHDIMTQTIKEFHEKQLFSNREKELVTNIAHIVFDPNQQIKIKKRNTDIVTIVKEIKGQKNENHQPKYKLVILSNMEQEMVPLFKEQFNDIAQLFDDAHYSGEIHKLKPYDDIYAFAEQKHNSKGCECYFIDDLDENIKAAQHRGWHTFHLHKQTTASQLREDLVHIGILPA